MRFPNTQLEHSARRWVMQAVVLVTLLLAIALTYSTARSGSMPAGAETAQGQNAVTASSTKEPPLAASGTGSPSPDPEDSGFAPFLHIVPSSDGTELWISAGRIGTVDGTVFANIGIGPGHEKHSWTMSYSETTQSYVTTAAGLSPNEDLTGTIRITTTLRQDSGQVNFERPYVKAPITEAKEICLDYNSFRLSLVNTDTFASNTYLAAIPSHTPPGPRPLGHRLVGGMIYTVRASGAIPGSNRPMFLRLYYDEYSLAGTDPHTLDILAWDAAIKRWTNLGARLQDTPEGDYLSVATSGLTTYALMATSTWRDEFDDSNGLDLSQLHNVTWGLLSEDWALVLDTTPGSGSAVSRPITRTTPCARWGTLAFAHAVDPPTTTLSVDVLGLDGSEVLTNVASGTDLADLVDPAQYPSLRLRVNMISAVTGETPALDAWQLAWQVCEHKAYLPLVLR